MLIDTLLLLLAGSTPGVAPLDPNVATQDPRAMPGPAYLALPYTYLGVNLVGTRADGFSDDPAGFELDGSYALTEFWFLYGSATFLEAEVGGTDVDLRTWRIGGGLHTPVAEHVDLVLGAGLLDLHADSSAPGSANDEGFELRGGVRIALSECAEAGAGLVYTDLDDAGDDTALYLNGAYYFEPRFGLTAGLQSTDDVDTLMIGLRFVP